MADYNKVTKEQDARKLYIKNIPYNGTTNSLVSNEGAAAKLDIEEDLDESLPDGFTSRVTVALGNYFVFKFYKDNKAFTTYKSKNATDLATAKTEAIAFFNIMNTVSADKLTASPASTTKAAGQTQVITITAVPTGASTAVTGVSSDPTKATVSGTTITFVAAGTANVTFTSTTSNAKVVVPVTVT